MIDPVVLCPLEIERKAAAKAVGDRAQVIRTGPGAEAVRRAVDDLRADPPPLVILFGVAGALRYAPLCPRIDRVIDEARGRIWRVNYLMPGDTEPVGVLGVDEVVPTPARKRVLRRRFHDASLVDCESHGFAEAMTTTGTRWTIIRGVSDWPHQSLPRQCVDWVRPDGRTAGGVVARDLARRPWMLGEVLSLRSRTNAALDAAGHRLSRLMLLEEVYSAIVSA